MDRLLTCECGREHTVSRSQAGQEINCDCGKILPVPTLRALSNLPLAQSAAEGLEKDNQRGSYTGQSNSTGSGWQGWRGPTIAVTSAGLLIATLACGWFLMQRWMINTSYTAESEIEAGNQIFDGYDPNELSETWMAFSKMGLRAKDPPDFHLWNLYAESRIEMAQISGGVAGLFAVLTFLLWVTVKKQPG